MQLAEIHFSDMNIVINHQVTTEIVQKNSTRCPCQTDTALEDVTRITKKEDLPRANCDTIAQVVKC